MIKISDKVLKKQKNFWNDVLFHPTDAVEDSWGKRIIDRFAEDKSVYNAADDAENYTADGTLNSLLGADIGNELMLTEGKSAEIRRGVADPRSEEHKKIEIQFT